MSPPRFVIAVVVLAAASTARGAEPQVAFVVEDGWVSFTLTRDERPVSAAQVVVYDSRGIKFAEGETGEEGRGEFPLPAGSLLRVEIKVGDRTADLIQLTKVDGRVVPANVLLSFGLAPCCRVSARGGAVAPGEADALPQPPPPSSPDAIPIWLRATGSVLFTLLGVAMLVAARRHPIARPQTAEAP